MKFQTTAENRKDIVKAMEEILGEKAIYIGAPSFGYTIGTFTINRDGDVETENEKEGKQMQSELIARGLAETEKDKMHIDMPMEGFTADSLKNLVYLIHSKQYLLEKAVGMGCLWVSDDLVDRLMVREGMLLEEVMTMIMDGETKGIILSKERISFDGFPFSIETANVYTKLVAAIVQMAKTQKRIKPQGCFEENEKYYMRSWLVRLGFGGKEGKKVRNVLLANLKGHTAFRTEEDRQKWQEKYGKKAGKEDE